MKRTVFVFFVVLAVFLVAPGAEARRDSGSDDNSRSGGGRQEVRQSPRGGDGQQFRAPRSDNGGRGGREIRAPRGEGRGNGRGDGRDDNRYGPMSDRRRYFKEDRHRNHLGDDGHHHRLNRDDNSKHRRHPGRHFDDGREETDVRVFNFNIGLGGGGDGGSSGYEGEYNSPSACSREWQEIPAHPPIDLGGGWWQEFKSFIDPCGERRNYSRKVRLK